MRTIYINETPLRLIGADAQPMPSTEQQLVVRHMGKAARMMPYIDTLEKSRQYREVVFWHPDEVKLIADFESLFKILPAAGGVVRNGEGEVLMIYRRGAWDLPKGKLDDGESFKAAAIREVQEETGVMERTLHHKITTTYHTYRGKKKKRILKPSHWYEMSTPGSPDLTPQAEEDIERAEWYTLDATALVKLQPMYATIAEVLRLSEVARQ